MKLLLFPRCPARKLLTTISAIESSLGKRKLQDCNRKKVIFQFGSGPRWWATWRPRTLPIWPGAPCEEHRFGKGWSGERGPSPGFISTSSLSMFRGHFNIFPLLLARKSKLFIFDFLKVPEFTQKFVYSPLLGIENLLFSMCRTKPWLYSSPYTFFLVWLLKFHGHNLTPLDNRFIRGE